MPVPRAVLPVGKHELAHQVLNVVLIDAGKLGR